MKAIIDNSALGNLLELSERLLHSDRPAVLYLLAKVFKRVYIPYEVIAELTEYEKESQLKSKFLFSLAPNGKLFRICTVYNRFDLIMIKDKKGIDPGESAAIAQGYASDTDLILIDDKNCIEAIKKNGLRVRCIQSLYVLSLLEIKGHIKDWTELMVSFRSISNFKDKDLRENYSKAYQDFTLSKIKKKDLEKKIRLSYLP